MRLLGFELTRAAKAAPPSLASVPMASGGWWPVIRESFSGAWQRNIEIRADTVLSHIVVFRCISLISGDIAKMQLRLITEVSPGVWEETESAAYTPVLRKPNHFQNRIQFVESWVGSKLAAGNTYVLKERDNRGVVVALYVLDPRRVSPLVADNGDVYYRLYSDNLAGVGEQVVVPASGIIHDRWNCLFHPLIGLSPIYAAGLAAMQSLRIQEHSTKFFENGARPGGILTAPGRISNETADRLREDWESKFSGNNAGRVAVLGDGLKYESMAVNALDSQLIEQLRWTAEMIAAAFGVPAYKVGVASPPAATNVEALQQQYYQDCLQIHIEAIELCVDEGLSLPKQYGVEFDLDGLLRMDTETKIRAIREGVQAGVLKPNDGRKRLGLGPVEGGDTPYLQVQNYSLASLARRDSQTNPTTPGLPQQQPATDTIGGPDVADTAEQSRALANIILRKSKFARPAA